MALTSEWGDIPWLKGKSTGRGWAMPRWVVNGVERSEKDGYEGCILWQ